jgi:hypothetical protein
VRQVVVVGVKEVARGKVHARCLEDLGQECYRRCVLLAVESFGDLFGTYVGWSVFVGARYSACLCGCGRMLVLIGDRLDILRGAGCRAVGRAQALGAPAVGAPALAREPLVGKAAIDAFALHDIGRNARVPRPWALLSRDGVLDDAVRGRPSVVQRVGHAGRVVFTLAVCLVLTRNLRAVVATDMFTRGCNSRFRVGLRGERDQGDVGDFVDGLAANLCDVLAARDGDEEQGRRDFEEA